MKRMRYATLTQVYRGKYSEGKLKEPILESEHLGIVAIVDEDGKLLFSAGDAESEFYIRSAAKPFQIIPLLESGAADAFDFSEEELALMCASHNAEPVHVQVVMSILNKIGLDERHLRCGAHWPMHGPTTEKMLHDHQLFTQLHNNCSGKHAGMLAYCVYHRLPLDTYLDFDHPLQLKILNTIQTLLRRTVKTGTDGCSAPVFVMRIRDMAYLYAQLAAGKTPALARVFHFMRKHPYMVAGDDRFDTDLITHSPVVAKIGAEGIECVAVPPLNGQKALGITVKIADGAFRALYPVVMALLKKMNILEEEQIAALKKYDPSVVLNHNQYEVGFIRSAI